MRSNVKIIETAVRVNPFRNLSDSRILNETFEYTEINHCEAGFVMGADPLNPTNTSQTAMVEGNSNSVHLPATAKPNYLTLVSFHTHTCPRWIPSDGDIEAHSSVDRVNNCVNYTKSWLGVSMLDVYRFHPIELIGVPFQDVNYNYSRIIFAMQYLGPSYDLVTHPLSRLFREASNTVQLDVMEQRLAKVFFSELDRLNFAAALLGIGQFGELNKIYSTKAKFDENISVSHVPYE